MGEESGEVEKFEEIERWELRDGKGESEKEEVRVGPRAVPERNEEVVAFVEELGDTRDVGVGLGESEPARFPPPPPAAEEEEGVRVGALKVESGGEGVEAL